MSERLVHTTKRKVYENFQALYQKTTCSVPKKQRSYKITKENACDQSQIGVFG